MHRYTRQLTTKISVWNIIPTTLPSSFTTQYNMNLQRRCIQTNTEPKHLPLTKIVATIGPASEQLPILPQAVQAGMRIMRLNFSHATLEEVNLRMKNLKSSPGVHASGRNMRAVMLDTQGPEIRTGKFADGVKGVELETDDEIIITTDESFEDKQTKEKIWISYKSLYTTVEVGTSVLLDDGAVEVEIVEKNETTKEVIGIVKNSGRLGNKKGVNLPGVPVDLPAMCDKDKRDIKWGIHNDVDYIAASFIRKKSDILEIKEYVATLMKEYHTPNHPPPMIISKVENTEALTNFDEILEESDAIMVARGDLGVEIPMETLTNVQKEIVKRCNLGGKPVIVATQMLESMQKNPRPTRAECTDVANAVFDGADCVMLSGESAKGKYPIQSVEMMNKIILETERWIHDHENDDDTKNSTLYVMNNGKKVAKNQDSKRDAFARAVVEATYNTNAKCIFVVTQTGETAADISKFKPNVPVLTFIHDEKRGKQLQLFRGVHPVLSPKTFSYVQNGDRFKTIVEHAKTLSFVNQGDTVIVVAAEEATEGLGRALTMRIASVA